MKSSLKYFDRNTIFSGLFFFFVLFSLFIMRPFRGAITAQIGTADLTYFLFIVVLVMLLANQIYSALASRIRESRLVAYVYGFFIVNLLIYAGLTYYLPESYVLGASFYVWYNIFNFFVVSVFWARTVNSFDYKEGKKYFGIISAFGSFGAWVASQTVLLFLTDKFFLAMILGCLSLMLAIYFSTKISVSNKSLIQEKKDTFFRDLTEQFRQIKSNPLVRQLLSYVFVWTCLSTALYFFSIEIVNSVSSDEVKQRELFAQADAIAIPLTLFTQIFLTRFLLQSKFFGVSFVLIFYGAIYGIGFVLMFGYFSGLLLTGSGALLFLIIQALVRPYEYAINKPARETVYTTLKKSEKYKSTVFIDTFMNRFGDASGGLLFNSLLFIGLSISIAPLAIIPLAVYLSTIGNRISQGVKK
ncbi:MAG: hypothetical protein CMQ75_04135 [Gammaproteobacteria bacterium]|nr:hypothetical protein [Gammaproteobacteria bacterium]|tara:strand:+ start:2813 stop:4054 length:1242 start_codon:yes stop_codon:yes gene_type:complete